jgi:hypothetical protein
MLGKYNWDEKMALVIAAFVTAMGNFVSLCSSTLESKLTSKYRVPVTNNCHLSIEEILKGPALTPCLEKRWLT